MARLRALTSEERNTHDFTHVYELDYTDLVASGSSATACTLTLMSNVGLGFMVVRAAFEVTTAFAAASQTALKAALKLASTDIIADTEWCEEGTEVLNSHTDEGILSAAAGDDITLVFAGTGGDLRLETAGAAKVYLKVSDPGLMN
jgi:hypothetical protein